MDTQIQFGNSKEQIKRMFNSLSHIKETIDNDVRRKIGESCRGCFFHFLTYRFWKSMYCIIRKYVEEDRAKFCTLSQNEEKKILSFCNVI